MNPLARTGRITLLVLVGLVANWVPTEAQQTGIRFESGSWDSIRAMARSRHCLIFVDVYTDWCRPCKLMDQEVFSQQAAGAFFNAHFINFRMNAEKGEGIALSAKYEVPSYPYYLWVDPSGGLVHQDHGFCNGNDLMDMARAALEAWKPPS